MSDYDRYRLGKVLEAILEAYKDGEKTLEDAVVEILSATSQD